MVPFLQDGSKEAKTKSRGRDTEERDKAPVSFLISLQVMAAGWPPEDHQKEQCPILGRLELRVECVHFISQK